MPDARAADVEEQLFNGKKSILARALFVGGRIDVRALERSHALAVSPLVVRAGEHGCAILFRYGAVVLFDLSALEEASFLGLLKRFVEGPFDEPESEDASIVFDPQGTERVDANENIRLHAPDIERLQVLADILAKSTVLARFEAQAAAVFDTIEPLGVELQNTGRTGSQGKELLRQIGDVLIMQHKMVGRVEIAEKTDLLWEYPALDRLFYRLQDEYELRERARILDRKLTLISRTAQTVLDLLQDKRTLRVEWYIVILILAEILLTLYTLVYPV